MGGPKVKEPSRAPVISQPFGQPKRSERQGTYQSSPTKTRRFGRGECNRVSFCPYPGAEVTLMSASAMVHTCTACCSRKWLMGSMVETPLPAMLMVANLMKTAIESWSSHCPAEHSRAALQVLRGCWSHVPGRGPRWQRHGARPCVWQWRGSIAHACRGRWRR